MPAKDKTGPRGQGPATGRGQGFCGNRNVDAGAGQGGAGMGRGMGRGGRGRGRGRGQGGGPMGRGGLGNVPVRNEGNELNALRAESSRLKDLLESIEQRLSKFEAPEGER